MLTFLILAGVIYYIIPANFTWMGYQSAGGDIAQHLSGWYAFVHEPWRFPLLKITSINYPAGTTISLTDSIPLFAVPFKLSRNFLPPDFNFFSFFVFFIYIFQAGAALLLAYSLNKNNFLITAALILLSLTAPILSCRTGGEDSLACQGFILLGISGYFFSYFKKWQLSSCHLFFGILIGVSLLVHPYLTAMTYPFYIISLLKLKSNQSLKWKVIWKPILIMHFFILCEAFIFGLGQDASKTGGFGIYNMNLLAPIYGGKFTNYHSIIPSAYPGEEEGFAYLGAGNLLMLIAACCINLKKYKHLFRQYNSLFIVTLLFFIYAIYGHIYFGQYKIINTGAPYFFITNNFRTNGRFFWPVWYTLMVFGLISLINFKPKFSSIFIIGCLCLQVFDVSPYIKNIKLELATNFTPVTLTPELKQIANLIYKSNIIIFYPKFACANMTNTDYMLLINTQLLTAKAGTLINTGYIAHIKIPSKSDCNDEANNFQNYKNKLLVSSMDNPSPTIQSLLKAKPQSCYTINQAYYCEYP